jgi:membrane-associated phospholipid phosphatase
MAGGGGVDSTDVQPGPPLTAAPDRPLISASVRRWAGAVLIACGAIAVVLGVLFTHQTTADAFDRAVDAPFSNAFASHQVTAYWLARPGSELPALLICAAIVVVCLLAGRLNGAILAALGLAVSEGITEHVLKPLFHRTYLGSLTYPSGHTTAIYALIATVTVLLLLPPRPARAAPLRYLILAAAYVLAVVVPVGLMGLRWHYFTDTVGGAAIGIGTVLAVALVLDTPVVRGWLAGPSRWLRAVSPFSRSAQHAPPPAHQDVAHAIPDQTVS